jgi:protease I
MEMKNIKVAVLATDGFEEAELTEPVRALRDAGISTAIVSPHGGKIQGFKHHDKSATVAVDLTLEQAKPGSFDALLLPGGALNADALRAEPKVRELIREADAEGKPIAAICHAPWELISAGVAEGRKLTSYSTIQDDLRNAGAEWTDEEVVVDKNWVTSRQPKDLPAFNREMLKMFSAVAAGQKPGAIPANDSIVN